uniref:GIY-YIG domain-containing protein n=1 Tax=Cacopsylla melanoneura TaxID=428564 RepID=A0A8D8VMZ3_9HEMI
MCKKQHVKEVSTIYNIGLNNGYTISYMSKILKNRSNILENKLLYSSTTPNISKPRYVRVPFLGKPSYNIAHKMAKNGLKAAFYPICRLGQTLYKHKYNNKMEYSGVYEIVCSCGAQYIGQTGRSFGVRIKEHLAIPKRYSQALTNIDTEEGRVQLKEKYKERSAVADHLIEEDHDPNLCTYNIKHVCKNGRKLDIST